MAWYAWAVLGWLGIQCVYVTAIIGKPREPRTPTDALALWFECGLVAWAVVELAT